MATFAGALQTQRIVLAGEDAESLFAVPAMADAVVDRPVRDHARRSGAPSTSRPRP